MVLTDILNGLKKRVNVSVDAGLTKERARQIWKSFNNKNKREVLELAGVSDATAHKSYQLGALSAGLAIALAKVAGVNPSYITAQSDSRGKFSKQTLNSFLETNGYANLTVGSDSNADVPAAQQQAELTGQESQGLQEPELEQPAVYSSDDEPACAASSCPGCCGAGNEIVIPEGESINLDEEELILLLRALNTRARWNISAREKLVGVIKLLL